MPLDPKLQKKIQETIEKIGNRLAPFEMIEAVADACKGANEKAGSAEDGVCILPAMAAGMLFDIAEIPKIFAQQILAAYFDATAVNKRLALLRDAMEIAADEITPQIAMELVGSMSAIIEDSADDMAKYDIETLKQGLGLRVIKNANILKVYLDHHAKRRTKCEK